MNYYIADTHFGHANIIRLCRRPFADAEEMDTAIIDNWNAVVTDSDDVYILGDFCYKSAHPSSWYLRQLNGRKHLITGNHDTEILSDPEVKNLFASISQMETVQDHGYAIFLCHYPVAEWPGFFSGTYHFFGHIHNSRSEACEIMSRFSKAFNVGADLTGFTPRTAKEIIEGVTR